MEDSKPLEETQLHESPVKPSAKKSTSSHKGQNSSSIHKFLVAAAIIQILLLLFVSIKISDLNGVAAAGSGGADDVAAPSAPSAPSAPVDMEALIDDDDVKGDPDAPVTIVEWSDFECPFCARFYSQTLSQLESEYIDTGKVKIVYRDFPLGFHSNAQKAAEAAECAGDQGKYWEMHDLLFEQGVSGGVASFKLYASQLALDTTEFNTCLDSDKHASEVQKDMADGAAAGIQGTPGFIINGKLVSGAQPFSVFKQVIDAELAG